MIKRIFKVTIDPALRVDFEADFQKISSLSVKESEGILSVEIGKPTKWNPDEYLMISSWDSEKSLAHFAGIKWNQAAIPEPMKKYAVSYSVDHFIVEDEST